MMQNQIKVDKNRKGILFFLVEDPPLAGLWTFNMRPASGGSATLHG